MGADGGCFPAETKSRFTLTQLSVWPGSTNFPKSHDDCTGFSRIGVLLSSSFDTPRPNLQDYAEHRTGAHVKFSSDVANNAVDRIPGVLFSVGVLNAGSAAKFLERAGERSSARDRDRLHGRQRRA